jgi:hypothetical protein
MTNGIRLVLSWLKEPSASSPAEMCFFLTSLYRTYQALNRADAVTMLSFA